MKVLMLNGSPRAAGNTSIALGEMEKIFREEGIETEIVQVGDKDIRSCNACYACGTLGKCVFDDIVNEVGEKLKESDGLVIASPVYFAAANPALTSLLTRLFQSVSFDTTMKVGASVVAVRRGGASAAFDELNKFMGIAGMPIATSQYWNSIHGRDPGEAAGDAEGLQTMRTLARNMTFLMKSIALGKKEYGLPAKEQPVSTNFIR